MTKSAPPPVTTTPALSFSSEAYPLTWISYSNASIISFILAVMISEMYLTGTCNVGMSFSSMILMVFSPRVERLFGMHAP